MEITAQAKYIRVSPRKAGLVAGLVRGLQVKKALAQLQFVNKKAGRHVSKLLSSAIANAKHNYNMTEDNLLIKQIWVGKGATFHRWMPKAHGRATPLSKMTSHITIVLDEINDSGVKEARRVEATAPVKLSDLAKQGEAQATAKVENHETKTKTDSGSKVGFAKKVFQRKAG